MLHNYNEIDIRKTGIYKITSKIDNRFYIGSASSINVPQHKRGFKGRLYSHLLKLNLNKHRNNILQNYYNKYGEESFVFEIIEFCSPNECKEREQYYLDLLKPYGDIGFNICRTSLGFFGKQAKRRKIPEGRNQKDICAHLGTPILQYDLNGNFIREFYSVAEASRQTKINRVGIYKCCREYQKTAGGFIWKYKNPLDNRPITVSKFKIKVTDNLNNTINFYNNWNEVTKVIDFCKSTLLIHCNNGELIEKQYLIEKIYL